MLTHDQFELAVSMARQRFAQIRKKYPELKARLVLSSSTGQTSIDSSPTQILGEFPDLVADGGAKTETLKILRSLESKTASNVDLERLRKQLEASSRQLKYDEQCQVEIRFIDLNYDLVWKLQSDDLIDRSLTPQTRASIRIVLGTLARFAEAAS